MTKCLGPHQDLDDFTTYDLTAFATSRLVIDLETGFTYRLQVRKSRKSGGRKSWSHPSPDVVPGTLSYL